ncbi:gluconokinase [Mucilaginibacter xinganensis]|uniref:Gluconokinase n=1 Tax=Mucilaginibacter xinganensis TaxID=1234841 RepID=A0A223NVC9_9SPHI|nr:gluconokinase [Mucilaginibacter xinganensis]ASU33832.1 gluconokinase [Mucilaginibacter xinganensis]
MEYVLGIDIGTGSVKAVAVNLQFQSFADHQVYYPFSSPKPGYHEQDPEQIRAAFANVIKSIILKIGSAPLAVSLSSAMHSLIPVDELCRPLAPMITWADNRSAEIAKRLRGTNNGMAIYKATGTPLHAMSPLCKIIWIKENDPQLFSKTYKFISIKEYIWHHLFNVFEVDQSIASCTGLFDIEQLTWHTDALKLAGITIKSLSRVVATDYCRLYVAAEKNKYLLSPDTPFIIGASDGCLANLGSMADKPGIAAITIGTSGAVRVASSIPLPNEQSMTFNYILNKETFICGGPVNNGGIALQWWLKNINPEADERSYEQLFQQIATVPAGCNGLLFLPYLTGERAPIWDSESCGTFFGVKLPHTQAHFSRAVLEGICYALKDVLDAVQQTSAPITQINVSGGIVRADLWVQTLADITGKKMVVVQSEDASAIGAAFMALKSIGTIKDYPTSDFLGLKTFNPNLTNVAAYANGFVIFKQVYEDLKATMHKVYQYNG